MPRRRAGTIVQQDKEADMHGYDGWDWAWMAPMMLFWVVVIGAVVYAAVRLAQRDHHERGQPS